MKFPGWIKIFVWTLVVALGVGAIGVLAWSRGEPVSALWVVVAAVCVFAVSYPFIRRG
jgi:carbon starvation protein